MEQETRNKLSGLIPGRVRFDVPLDGLTSYGLGGPAAAVVEPNSVEDLVRIMDFIETHALPVFVLGGGSNVLFRDGGFPGVVVRLGVGFADIAVVGESGDDVLVEAGASAPLAQLLALTRREGLSGLEFMAGIPGWVGGALAMNAGAHGGTILDPLNALTILDASGEVAELGRNQIRHEYRRLVLPEGAVILKARFSLRRSTPDAVDERVKANLARRSATQPKGVRSAGCVFRNPPGQAAGRLIDEAGLKGRSVGGAWVAREHANFIVHEGAARAAEIIELMDIIRSEVKTRFQVDLEPEIKIVGVNANRKPE